MVKFVVVTGSVISGIGKGITSSAIGLLFQMRGLHVTAIKIDPYLNIDAGTMSPYEHGECYVLEDGGEVDLDLGNYERFLDINLTKKHSITTGKVYQNVLNKERAGAYLGKTIQIVPHITNEIMDLIQEASQIPVDAEKNIPDICIIEVGGTVGDIEIATFIDAIRQLSFKLGRENFCFVHVSMTLKMGDDLKTKPIQQGVTTLRSLGIFPDILIVRTDDYLDVKTVDKLETFCSVKRSNIISNIKVPNIYFVPKIFEEQDVFGKIAEVIKLNNNLEINSTQKSHYDTIIGYFDKIESFKKYRLVIAGKYCGSQDTYLSLIRAIEHAMFKTGEMNVVIEWLNTENDELDTNQLEGCNGIIIPGGFGSRGIIGKLKVAEYARLNKIPCLGICLGMQVMVVDVAKNVCGLDATSSEWELPGVDKVINILPDQTGIMGGTMRLGLQHSTLKRNSMVRKMYILDTIEERHRHRYEVDNDYVEMITNRSNLRFVGFSKGKTDLMEIVELIDHPYWIGCQFHPELKTKYNQPHPLFIGLMHAMKTKK